MKVSTLPDGGNPRVIGTLTLDDVDMIRVTQLSESHYLIAADERSFHLIHRARHSPQVDMCRFYGRRYSGPKPNPVVEYIAHRQAQVVVKRLDKHSYGLRAGNERFIFHNTRENGPPVELVDRLTDE